MKLSGKSFLVLHFDRNHNWRNWFFNLSISLFFFRSTHSLFHHFYVYYCDMIYKMFELYWISPLLICNNIEYSWCARMKCIEHIMCLKLIANLQNTYTIQHHIHSVFKQHFFCLILSLLYPYLMCVLACVYLKSQQLILTLYAFIPWVFSIFLYNFWSFYFFLLIAIFF